GAGLDIDRFSATSLGPIDRPENVFRPAWRLELPQPAVNLHEVVHLDAMRHLPAQYCLRIDRGADRERLDDVRSMSVAVDVGNSPIAGLFSAWAARYGPSGLLLLAAYCYSCVSSCLISVARCAGTGSARTSYWLLRPCPIAESQTPLSRAGFNLLREGCVPWQ